MGQWPVFAGSVDELGRHMSGNAPIRVRLAAGAEADAIEAAVTLIRQYPGVTGAGREEGNVLTVDFDGGEDATAGLLKQLAAGAPLVDFHRPPLSLEKVFMGGGRRVHNPYFCLFGHPPHAVGAYAPLLHHAVVSPPLAALAYFTVITRASWARPVALGRYMRLSVETAMRHVMIMLQFGMLVLVAPAMTAGSISGERERQTLDLLLVTNTRPVKLVLGKLLESFRLFPALLVMCSLPMLSLVLITGGATLAQVLISVAFRRPTALAALSAGLGALVSLFQRT